MHRPPAPHGPWIYLINLSCYAIIQQLILSMKLAVDILSNLTAVTQCTADEFKNGDIPISLHCACVCASKIVTKMKLTTCNQHLLCLK